ncbi:MAG: hypothetical protein SXG53_00290 [Pseudomonadota bacterium]|nr:hypothetical protein [Pseudomonadota bacterium]
MAMATAALFDSVATMVHPSRRLAMRGRADFADQRRTKVEKKFKGQFRALSMASAVDYVVMLAQQGIFKQPC